MKEYFENFIGCRLSELNNEKFVVVTPDGDKKVFTFIDNEGDCCGFNIIKNSLFISEKDFGQNRNPIITNIEIVRTDRDDADVLKITFFGEYGVIGEIDSLSSSGSGWCYGASVSIYCKKTKEKVILTKY